MNLYYNAEDILLGCNCNPDTAIEDLIPAFSNQRG